MTGRDEILRAVTIALEIQEQLKHLQDTGANYQTRRRAVENTIEQLLEIRNRLQDVGRGAKRRP